MIRRLITSTCVALALIVGTAFSQAAKAPAKADAAKTATAKADTAKAIAATAQAKADTAQAKADTAQAKANKAQSKADKAQSKAGKAQAKADTAQAKATAQAKVDTAKAKAVTAQAKVDTARAKAAKAQAKVDTAKAKAATAQAKVDTAKAAAKAAVAKVDTAKAAAKAPATKATPATPASAKADTGKTAATKATPATPASVKADTAKAAKALAKEAKAAAKDTAKAAAKDAKAAAKDAKAATKDTAKAATPATSAAAKADATAANTIKIGALFAVTGPAGNLGAPEAKTAEMMVEQINAKGGVKGKKLVLLIKDTGGNPEKAISLTKQLIEEDKVFAIIGPSTSGETMKIKSICEDAKTILVSCAAAEVIVNPVAKYVFKVPQKDSDAVRKIYQTMQKLKVTKIAILSSNTGFGGAGKAQLEALAPEFKMEVVANEVYDKEATDLTSVATKVKAANPQAIVNWSIEPAQSIIIKNIRQVGMTIPIFQSHGFGNINFVKQAGEAAEGVIFPAGRLLVADVLPAAHPQKALLAAYKKDYETKYKEDVSTFGGHAYDAILVLTKAIEVAGADKEKARDALENIKGLVGTAGIFNMSATDHNGLLIDAFEMLTVKAGKFIVYQ